MVPIFRRRSIIILAVGLIIGAAAGLGYWAVSPVTLNVQAGWPLIRIEGVFDSPPAVYGSTVTVEPLGTGVAPTDRTTLNRRAQYWAYRLTSYSFYDFLGRELAEDVPEYAHTSEELAQMTRVRLMWGDVGTTIEIQATSQSAEESRFLATLIPQVFESYLIAEDQAMQEAQYQGSLQRFNTVKLALTEAQNELAALTSNGEAEHEDLDAAYRTAVAMIGALQIQLDNLASRLASFIAAGLGGAEYQETLAQIERVSAALAEATKERDDLEVQMQVESGDVDYAVASAKVRALAGQLNNLAAVLTSPPTELDSEQAVSGLFMAREPSSPTPVPVDKVRGRNALMIGAVLGVCGAWLGLNFKGLVRRARSSSLAESTWDLDESTWEAKEEDSDEEDMA